MLVLNSFAPDAVTVSDLRPRLPGEVGAGGTGDAVQLAGKDSTLVQ